MTTLAESPTTASLALGVASKVGSVGGSAIWAAGSYLVGGAVTVGGAAAEGLARAATASPEEGGTLRPMGGGSEVLRIANALEGILGTPAAQGKIKQPEVPRLVVVGTQSSGKSSLLNGIMAADILPLGEQMCTRAPLSLQLVHTPDPSAMRAEFGGFTSGVWAPTETIALQCPDPTAPQLAQIRAAIESQTSARAGAQKGVSHEPIFLRIHSPHVPNLSLVDLPGLTMTALTDQGQPRDIKAQIKRMIGGYIEQERTIILMVCPARMDLEADPALELVKEYDPQGNRTVGVLTKIDLMNAGSDVSRYLANAVPADLQLRHGYFAVRNRAPAEVATATVADGFGLEEAYFAQHPTYAKAGSALRERLGVPPLSRFLARILSDHLRQHLPEISREIHALVAEHEQARETPARPPPPPRPPRAPAHSRLAPRLPLCRRSTRSAPPSRPTTRRRRRCCRPSSPPSAATSVGRSSRSAPTSRRAARSRTPSSRCRCDLGHAPHLSSHIPPTSLPHLTPLRRPSGEPARRRAVRRVAILRRDAARGLPRLRGQPPVVPHPADRAARAHAPAPRAAADPPAAARVPLVPEHGDRRAARAPRPAAAGAGDRALPAAAASDARGDGRTLRDAPGREREEAPRARRDGGGERRDAPRTQPPRAVQRRHSSPFPYSLPLQAYISTDDPAFLAELAAVVKKLVNRMDASLLRSLLVSYYSTVQRALNNGAPKAIMRFLVRGCHESVYGYMFDRIARQPPKDVLAEPEEVETKRRADMETLAKLRVACQALSSLST